MILTCVVTDLYQPCINGFAQDFGIDPFVFTWLRPLSFSGYASGFLVFAFLGPHCNLRQVLILATLITALGSLGCLIPFHVNYFWLGTILMNIGSGIGFGAFYPVASIYHNKRGVVNSFSLMAIQCYLSRMLSPVAGAYIEREWGAYMNLLIIAFLALIMFLVMLIFFPTIDKKQTHITLKGMLLLVGRMCRNLSFIFYCLLCVVSLLSRIAFLTVGPFLYVKYYNLSSITYSYLSGLVILACIAGLSLQNFLSFRLLPSKILQIGGMFFGVGAFFNIFVQLIGKDNYMLFSILTAVTMVGSGLLYPIGMGYGIAVFKRDSKTAAGVFTFIRTVLCTIGLIILAAFFSKNPLSFGLFLSILALLGGASLVVLRLKASQ